MSSETHFFGQITQKALIQKGDKYLLVVYAEGDSAAGLWDMPGGRLNEGELPEDGLRRELREEIGVAVTLGPILGTATFTNMSKFRNLLILYSASLTDAEPKFELEDGKIERIDWFTKEELLKLPFIYPEYPETLKKYL